MTALNKRNEYGDFAKGQADKSTSLSKASNFVNDIITELSPKVQKSFYYENEKKLGNAPAIELPDGNLIIAPDIKCITKSGKTFWVEAKDKSQRFYKPDTGADLFQVYGWYQLWKNLNEPVFVVFKDPKYDLCLPRTPFHPNLEIAFRERWQKFNGFPYGGWLSNLLIQNNGYPQIFAEKSREMAMYIFYFFIQNMHGNINWDNIIKDVEDGAITPIQQELQAFYNNELLSEARIVKLIKELFTK